MEVCLLGPLAVRKEVGSDLDEIQPPIRSAILLGSVALTRRPVGREELMQRLWPFESAKRTEANLNGYVTKARTESGIDVGQLRADRSARNLRLLRADEGGAGILVDADRLFAAEGASERRLLIQALEAVRGQFLDGYDETRFPWIADARSSCIVIYVKLVRRVTGWPSARASDFVKRFLASPSGTLWDVVAQEMEDSTSSDQDADDRTPAAFRAYFRDATVGGIESLQRLLLSDRAPLYDATVELRLSDASAEGRYTLRMTLNYRTRQDRFACALVARAVHTDLLLAECPELSDSFALSEDGQLDSYLETPGKTSDVPGFGLYQIDKSPSGNTKRRELKLRVASEEEKAQILGGLHAEVGDRVVIVTTAIPGPAGSMRRLNYWVESDLSVDEHYCFWVADRPTHVERITIDYSDFTAPSARGLRLHPMLGNAASEPHLENSIYTIEVDNWLIRDQGVFVTW